MTAKPLTFEFSQDHATVENGGEESAESFAMPALSAYNEATELFRIPRLGSAWGGACTAVRLLSNRYQARWSEAIVSLNDHKGTLQVTWRDAQSRVMFEGVMMGAWEREGENCGAHALSRALAETTSIPDQSSTEAASSSF